MPDNDKNVFGEEVEITLNSTISPATPYFDEEARHEMFEALRLKRIQTAEKLLDETMVRKFGDGIKGLPVAGYRPTQSPEVVEATQQIKFAEERFYRLVEKNLEALGADGRDSALAKTYAQIAFSTAVRAIMKPGRVSLPEDAEIDMEASKGPTGEE